MGDKKEEEEEEEEDKGSEMQIMMYRGLEGAGLTGGI